MSRWRLCVTLFTLAAVRGQGQGDIGAPSAAAPRCAVSEDDPDADCIVGRARVDYPTLKEAPVTSFSCDWYPSAGLYPDIEADCQAFHVCPPAAFGQERVARAATFLCPAGTLFSREHRICDWWYNVQCGRQRGRGYFGSDRPFYGVAAGPDHPLLRAVNQ